MRDFNRAKSLFWKKAKGAAFHVIVVEAAT